jgi:hypothetical protein
MIRYYNPRDRLLDTKQLAEFSHYIALQTKAAGLECYDPAKHGSLPIPEGALVQVEANGTGCKPLDAPTLIRFANVVQEKLKSMLGNVNELADRPVSFTERYKLQMDKHLAAALS